MQKFRFYGYLGGFLMAICWAGNWFLPGYRTQILFFPQWLGLILLIDAWIFSKKNTSLIHRNFRRFISLFFLSIPVWWLFELLNERNQNWIYVGRDHFSNIQFFILASISFSTVIPAVFEMAELFSTFQWASRFNKGPRISKSRKTSLRMLVIGAVMLSLDLLWPGYFFVFMWVSIYLILEGINIMLDKKTLVVFTDHADWGPVYVLAMGCLTCGFLWECWNFYSYPKWIYDVPFVGYAKIFEMPLLGYLGYIPFSFELYAIYMLLTHTRNHEEPYIRIS